MMLLYKTKKLDQKFIEVGHNVQYQNVFLKFDNDSYDISSSGVITPSLLHCAILYGIQSLSPDILITT